MVQAQAVPEVDRHGSIQVELRYAGNPVGGGTWVLYRVAEIRENDGDFFFAPVGVFTQWDGTFENVRDEELAQKLYDFARSQNATGSSLDAGQDGIACYEDLETGLYLLAQKQAPAGYEEIHPFLISVPAKEDGVYQYDVDASPKVALSPAQTEPEPTESKPTGPSLPQTGQLNWPVPVLTVVGLCLLVAGWVLFSRQKRDEREA